MLVFVDTNLLVYAFDPSQGEKHVRAAQELDVLLRKDRVCLSTQVLQELYVTLTRKSAVSTETALTVLDDLSLWPLFKVDFMAIREAVVLCRQHRLSFWDSLLIAAALRLGASQLLSEEMQHGQKILGIEIRNPFFT